MQAHPRQGTTRARRRRPALLVATLLVAGLVVPTGSVSAEDEGYGSANIEPVSNVQFPDHRVPGAGTLAAATDSDFVEFTIPAAGGNGGAPTSPACQRPAHAGNSNPPHCAPGGSDDAASAWALPGPDENGGIDLPADYAPQPGEDRVFNLMGTYDNGLFVTDVTDPAAPVTVARWDCGVLQADVFVFDQVDEATGDTRSYAAYTLDATSNVRDTECARTLGVEPGVRGTFLAEVTDPYRPRTVSFLPMRKGTHQTTAHPSGQYIYNSAAVLVTNSPGTIEVYDVSDPAAPQLVSELELQTGLDSHDMTFNEDGTRLYAAALTHSLVIDTSDPADPQIISRIFDPTINIHHDAHAVTVDTTLGERTYLLVGDELAGAAGNGFCPGGGIHVFDITGPLEAAPLKVGAFFIPDLRPAGLGGDTGSPLRCTSHVIQVLPEEELLVMAWYNAGVRVLDYSGLADLAGVGGSVGVGNETLTPGIRQVGWFYFPDTDLWSAKVHEVADDGSFHIFGGDIRRHLDIWRYDPDGDSSAESGSWLGPGAVDQLGVVADPGAVSTLDGGDGLFCLLPVA
jgi:hypothetical protein